MTLLLRARLPIVTVSVMVSAPRRVEGMEGPLSTRGTKRPGPDFGETHRNTVATGYAKALVLKGFLSFGVFHRRPKYSPHDFAVRVSRARQSQLSRPSHPDPRFVTNAHTPLVGRDGTRSEADLPSRSSATAATHWHDGQISECAVKFYFLTRWINRIEPRLLPIQQRGPECPFPDRQESRKPGVSDGALICPRTIFEAFIR